MPTDVASHMTRNPVTVNPETDVLQAIGVMLEKRISGMPVVDRLGNLVGMLSEKDCMKVALQAGYHEGMGGPVSEYMHPGVETLEAEASIFAVARRFTESPYRRYPVLKDNRLVGIISRRDLLRAIVEMT